MSLLILSVPMWRFVWRNDSNRPRTKGLQVTREYFRSLSLENNLFLILNTITFIFISRAKLNGYAIS